MTVAHGYISLDALKVAVGDPGDVRDDDYERAISAASRQIDEWCGRHFWQEPTPVARVFVPDTPCVIWTGDFATLAGLTVETDVNGAGTWLSLAAPYWQAEPFTPRAGRPYDRITAASYGVFPWFTWWPSVRVTARWGWPSVPSAVEQACLQLAVDHYKAKDLTGGVAGFGDFGPVRVSAFNPQARSLLAPFKETLEP